MRDASDVMEPRPGEAFGDRDFGRRVVTGLALALAGGTAILMGGHLFLALLLVAAVAMAFEYARLQERAWTRQRALFVFLVVVLVAALPTAALVGVKAALALLGLAAAAGGLLLARRLGGVGWAWALGPLYLGGPLVALWWLRHEAPAGAWLTFWIVAVVAATDMGGYFVGRTLRGPRLAPALSPNKTWSGLWGGVALAALVGGGLAAVAHGGLDGRAALAALLAALLAVVEQMGDLFESWLKRRSGYKDSGGLLPGHGGVLDRLDGLLFAAPAFALALLLVGVPGDLR